MKSNTKLLIAIAILFIAVFNIVESSNAFLKKTNENENRYKNNNYNGATNAGFRPEPNALYNQKVRGNNAGNSPAPKIDKKRLDEDSEEKSQVKTNTPYKDLVTEEKPKDLCSPENAEKEFKHPGDKMKLPDGYNVNGPPQKKENNWMIESGNLEQISYFFDYIDPIFQNLITNEMKALLDAARAIPEEDALLFDDPYSAEKLLWYWSNGQEGLDPIKGDANAVKAQNAQAVDKIIQYKKDFNKDLWIASFSAGKISNIIKQFGWAPVVPIRHAFKILIDKYDFDGNGRLDDREFLFFAIWENHKNYSQCQKFCFKEIIEKYINPLFTFFDCDNDGFINSENLWNGMKFLKRPAPEKFDFYKCEVPKAFNKFYRTHAPNDFVLKNYETADGYLNRDEWRKGLLLGYWERQTNKLGVVPDDSVNGKKNRWSDEKKDIDCEQLLIMYK